MEQEQEQALEKQQEQEQEQEQEKSFQVGERCLTPDLVTGLSPHSGHPGAKVGITPAPSSSSPACLEVPHAVHTCSLPPPPRLVLESLVQTIPAPFLLLPCLSRSPLYSVY